MEMKQSTGACSVGGKNYSILEKRILVEGADGIHLTVVNAPLIARHAQAGQFVIVRSTDHSERIPLTIAAYDRSAGTITLIFQIVGHSTAEMARLKAGDAFTDILGPLGTPIEVKKHEHPVVLVGGGVGVAPIWPKVKELYELGNHVVTIIGARSQRLLILEEELRAISHEFYVTTDDGSYGRKGFVTQQLHDVIAHYEGRVSEVVAVGPIPMMEAVVKEMAGKSFRETFEPAMDYDPRRIPLIVSLNPIMVDGTGMCGGCRVQIYNANKGAYEPRFSCVDGPAFDGYAVDFGALTRRNRQYLDAEKRAQTAHGTALEQPSPEDPNRAGLPGGRQ
jgi:ferredoxin/flavodoxin---NADP+ reductase